VGRGRGDESDRTGPPGPACLVIPHPVRALGVGLSIVRFRVLTNLTFGLRLFFMNNTVATTKRMTVKMKRLLCQHANVIELADGVTVCTACGKVSK